MKTAEINRTARAWARLVKIERALNRLDCTRCNGVIRAGRAEWTDTDDARYETRLSAIMVRATYAAGELECRPRHQGDPRGASLYLVDVDGCEIPCTPIRVGVR